MTRTSMHTVAAHTGSLIQGMGIRDYTGSVPIGALSSLSLHLPVDHGMHVIGLDVENWVINIVFCLWASMSFSLIPLKNSTL